jgi:hypothetical protein
LSAAEKEKKNAFAEGMLLCNNISEQTSANHFNLRKVLQHVPLFLSNLMSASASDSTEIPFRTNFRRSTINKYTILPLKNGRTSNFQIDLKPTTSSTSSTSSSLGGGGGNGKQKMPFLVRHAEFAPKGNALVYVDLDCNIYYR